MLDEADDEGDYDKDDDTQNAATVASSSTTSAVPPTELTPAEKARAVAASMAGDMVPQRITAQAAIAKAMALANRLGNKPAATAEVPNSFTAELEINDYPPQARRKATVRSVLDQVTDMTGTNVISRGSYIPPGKKPEGGERKLFLLIEGPTDLQVKQCKLELTRLLEEETMKLGASSSVSASAGRYSVL